MLRRYTYNKFYITTLSLLIVFLFMIFPVKEKSSNFETHINTINNEDMESIFLLDKNNYLTTTYVLIDSNSLEETLFNKLNILIKDSMLKGNIPKNFTSYIPEGTKILSLKIKNNNVTVNFSKEILNVKENLSEKMIEGIIFTLCEDPIKSINILVEGKPLTKINNLVLPSTLTREFGINKKYDINSITEVSKTTVYYVNDIDDNIYYTPVTYITNDNRDKVSIIIDELSNTKVYQSTLKSYLNSNATLNKYEEIGKIMYLTFNEGLINENLDNFLLETVKYTISMSIKENYDVNDVIFK